MIPEAPEVPRGVEARWYVRPQAYRFRVRWTVPGSKPPRRPVMVFDTVEEASDFHVELERLRRLGTLASLSRGQRDLADFVAHAWWPNFARGELARSTLRSYASVWNRHLDPRIGHLRRRAITTPEVQQLREGLEADGVGAPTIRKALAILQGICRYAVVLGELDANPVREVEKPPVTRQRAVVPPSPAQVELLLAELRARRRHASRAARLRRPPRRRSARARGPPPPHAHAPDQSAPRRR